jgi:trimeric autotransporter adhesin
VGVGLDLDVRALALAPNGDVLAGGQFNGRLIRFNGTSWSVVSGGVSGTSAGGGIIRAIKVAPDGTIYIGGDFDSVNVSGAAVAVRDVAALRPNGTWNALAGGFDTQYIQSNGTTFSVRRRICAGAGCGGRVVCRWGF